MTAFLPCKSALSVYGLLLSSERMILREQDMAQQGV
jgi:hypothetical protein